MIYGLFSIITNMHRVLQKEKKINDNIHIL